MKITVFWNKTDAEELVIAEGIVQAKQKNFKDYFQSVDTCRISAENKCDTDLPGCINALTEAFRCAQENDIEFGIFSNSATWILDGHKLRQLLEQKQVQGMAFSLRVGDITGKAVKFGSRLPFIDDNFIIFNTKRCDELGIFDGLRLKNVTSHFEEWGGNHASLFSFFEACVPYGDIYIYSDGSDCQGLFGDRCNFYPSTYLYSHKYGFLSSNPQIDFRIHPLRAELLHRSGFSEVPGIKEYIVRYKIGSDNFYFDQNIPFLKEKVLKRIAKKLIEKGENSFRMINYEFKKGYSKAGRY